MCSASALDAWEELAREVRRDELREGQRVAQRHLSATAGLPDHVARRIVYSWGGAHDDDSLG
jgi:hypothetical protein